MAFTKKVEYVSLAWLVILSGCASIDVQSPDETDIAYYQKAINDAAVIESSEITRLPTIGEGTVKVVTWTKYPQSFQEGSFVELDWGDLWVTLDNDVKEKCLGFDNNTLAGDIQKLLGLPPIKEKRSFITLEVDTRSLFRPCADPSIENDKCSAEFPEDTSPMHVSWYAHQAADSYKKESGYPWTRLGYTYNWKQGENEVGVAEFVVKKDSKVLTISVEDTDAYCSQ